jgi:GH24 family phage-related lysozyme (muramidase)
MTSKTSDNTDAIPEGQKLPVLDTQRGACVDFVEFCKEQHLNARAANTFLRVLHNKTWEAECHTIREAMRPEVDRIFGPAERALKEGANCKAVLAVLVQSLKEAEDL